MQRNIIKITVLVSVVVSMLAVLLAMDTENYKIDETEALNIGVDAYLYGYPLITSEITRIQMTNVANVNEKPLHGPMGQLVNVKRYPPADYRGVTAPNADTLYTAAWIDLSDEPWIFSWPDMGERYFLFPIYSLWTSVIEAPGSRTMGEKGKSVAITGPNWYGTLPSGVQEIESPTHYVFIIGRTYSTGTSDDYAAVNKLQTEYKLYPLSFYGKNYTPPASSPVDSNPPFSMTDKVRDVIDNMDIATYFGMMANLMGEIAPPAPEDRTIVDKMAKIGLVPGESFRMDKLKPSLQKALGQVAKKAFAQITEYRNKVGTVVNGWTISGSAGNYGTNYLERAVIAAFGWGANLPEDAVYPYTEVDSQGQKLSGANKYVIHFEKGSTPPVNGFWSITLYDKEFFFYPNQWNKQTVSPRDNLKYNSDGSLDLYIQHESPGNDKEANWLPTPEGDFILMMRLYWPKENAPSILPPGKGSWKVPPVVLAK